MRTAKLLALAALAVPTSCAVSGCESDARNGSELDRTREALAANTVGGGGDFSGGSGQWGGGGSLFAGGNGFWSGGGNWAGGSGVWSGGSGLWGGGSGEWSGGGDLFAGGSGFWNGGSGNWNGGGNNWGGGGNWWSGGGSDFAGGGSNFAGGGSNFAGGSGLWGGGSGLWSGGFASAFPFVGWSGARNWQFRGVPQPASKNGGTQYQAAVPSTWPAFSGTGDTTACATGYVRLGGFNANFDADGWPGFLALGYSKGLCIPTPGGQGLRVQATAGDGSMMGVGGYVMNGDAPTATTSNAQRDAYMMTSLVGAGTSNVATQYGGALCASIGTLAAARRSCAVGIAMADPNTAKDGSLTPRGAAVKSGAQTGIATYNTPFGRPDGHGLYGQAAGDMESYANHVMQEHQTLAVPTSASAVDAWNNGNFTATPSFKGGDFAPRTLAASPTSTTAGASASAADLLANINRSVASPLNMVPIDAIPTSPTDALNIERTADMNNSVAVQNGKLYALNLHTLAQQENPLYGSGGGRWFFHDPSDPAAASKPLLDLSAIYQAPTRFLTGQLDVGVGTLAKSYLTESSIAYADWHGNPAGTFGIDHAGQYPSTVASDADREARLRAALALPSAAPNIGLGLSHTCAVLSAGGGVKCWGYNGDGELGNGTQIDSTTPVQVSGLTAGVTAVISGRQHSCALLVGGTVKCWGDNALGELGNGSTADSTTPVPVAGLSSNVVALAAGAWHTCALASDGTVSCWGNNSDGQIGNGMNGEGTYVTSATQVIGISNATALAAGMWHTCALLSTGGVQCWGYNGSGELGDGSGSYGSDLPVQVSGLTSGVTAISGGRYNSCAVLSTGALKCWGYNPYGEVGDGSTTTALTPVQVSGLTSVTAVANGDFHTCALLSTGAVSCWGHNSHGEFGNGSTADSSVPTSTSFPAATSLSLGPNETCVRTSSSGEVRCSGDNGVGQLGVVVASSTTPQSSGVSSGASAIASGGKHACAVVSGALKCWGDNGAFALGDGGTEVESATPVQVYGLTSGVTAVATGGEHTCALISSGSKNIVECWGGNTWGAVGNGAGDVPVPLPTQVSLTAPTAIAAGDLHTCAVDSGDVKCWGYNDVGQLGPGTANNQNLTPLSVGIKSGSTVASAVVAGAHHSCALLSTGVVKCWGGNTYGQLGNGTTTNSATPVQVSGLTGVLSIAAGANFTCARLSTAVKCWGRNWYGELGNGTTTNSTVPVAVSGLSGVSAISAGSAHGCAVLSTGATQCWGRNAYSQLGNGTAADSTTAVAVSGVTSGATAVGSGGEFSCAVISGAVKCWGQNGYGQLGSGTPNARTRSPVLSSYGFTNGALVNSQASVLVRKFAAASGTVTGHVTPIAYTMVNATTGKQALMVTYDPLSAAAAMFIEQYQSHVDACNRTCPQSSGTCSPGETITETQEQAGTYLWACSNQNAKSAYLSGMQTLLAGARTYLFGRSDGSATAPCSGATSPSYCIDTTQAHMPYTFVVPAYTEAAYNPEYYGQLDTALGNYRTGIFGSNASALHKSLQLAGIAQFDTDHAAVVTTRVKRSGAFGTQCVTSSSSTCTPTTCAAQGKNCGTISDGCGGTLTCGSCTSPQTCGGGGTANVCGGSTAPLLGSTTAGTLSDGDSAGSAEAFRMYASSTGSVSSLSVYIASGTASSTVIVGIYSDSGSSQPGTLLASGTVTSPQASTWNTVTIPSTSLTSGTPYWVAVLGPSGGINYETSSDSAGLSKASSSTTLTALPTTWSTGASYTGATISAYAQ